MAATENGLRLAVVGLGGWGKNILRTACRTQHAKVQAICDSNPQTLRQLEPQYPGVRATPSYADILSSPEIDAVLLATPAPMHHTMVMEALSAGKDVYVEKPMAMTVQEAEAMVTKADEANRTLMVGHLLEYHPGVQVLKDLIQKGELGDIFYIYSKRLNLGVIRQEENALWSLAPHDISVILYLLNEEPKSVIATGQVFLQPNIEDVVFVNLRFDNQSIAQIHVSWLDPHKERKLVIVGSKKMAVFDDMHPNMKVWIYDKGAEIKKTDADTITALTVRHGDIHVPLVPNGEPLMLEIQHFVDSVRNGTRPRSDGYDGLRVVKVLESATRSLQAS
ncbi:MAG: Gfo/Idh/MocA family oxidoreductase, partial [bacterium]